LQNMIHDSIYMCGNRIRAAEVAPARTEDIGYPIGSLHDQSIFSYKRRYALK